MKEKVIYIAGGCFWGVEKYFESIKGVILTEVGYANGKTQNPTYEDVCFKNTGHAEAIKIIYDEEIISLDSLLNYFYKIIDPTSLNRQGNDIGIQYRTGIYYTDKKDLPTIKKSLKKLQKEYALPIVVEVNKLDNYFTAEYHQKYLDKNPGGYCHIPKSMFDSNK